MASETLYNVTEQQQDQNRDVVDDLLQRRDKYYVSEHTTIAKDDPSLLTPACHREHRLGPKFPTHKAAGFLPALKPPFRCITTIHTPRQDDLPGMLD